MAPMIVMTSDTTAAKIGRSMKKLADAHAVALPASASAACEPGSLAASCPARRRPTPPRRRAPRAWARPSGRAGALQALGDHPFVARACLRAPRAARRTMGPSFDGLARHRAVLADDIDELVGLVGADRLVGQQHGRRTGAVPVTRTRANRPGENSPALLRITARARSVPVPWSRRLSRKSSLALVREAALVGQRDLDGGADIGRARAHAALGQALVLDVVVLADVEVDVDRVLADDGGEQRGAGGPSRR